MTSGSLLGLWDPAGPAGSPIVSNGLPDLGSVDPNRTVIVRCRGREARGVRRALAESGRSVGTPLVVVPAGGEAEHVVAFDRTFRWSGALLDRSATVAAAVSGATAVPGGRAALSAVLPSVALVGVPATSPPAQSWLGRLGPASTASRSHRTDAVTATLRLGDATAVRSYVQVGLDVGGRQRVDGAANGLRVVGPSARLAGIDVPEILDGPPGALATAAMEGRCLGLVGDRSRRESAGERLIAALGRWQAATASTSSDAAISAVENAAALLGARNRALGTWAESIATRLRSAAVPTVAVHGDVTVWNVVQSPTGSIGLVDWESARPAGLAMTDCWYLLADLAVAAGASRREAVLALADGVETRHQRNVAPVLSIENSLGIDRETGALLFAATWVLHAAEESSRHESGGFVDAARALAQRAASA